MSMRDTHATTTVIAGVGGAHRSFATLCFAQDDTFESGRALRITTNETKVAGPAGLKACATL
jgi:hypothetical protein